MTLEGEYIPSPVGWARKQVEEFEASNGASGATLGDAGPPIVVITYRGVRSGGIRKLPVMRVEHDGRYAAVASMGGAPQHPQWYYTFRTEPEVDLQDGPIKQRYRVRELDGDERRDWWDRSVAAFPNYAEYQTKTDRLIPVFLLEPVAAQ